MVEFLMWMEGLFIMVMRGFIFDLIIFFKVFFFGLFMIVLKVEMVVLW